MGRSCTPQNPSGRTSLSPQERDLRERERKRRKCRMVVVVAGCTSASLPCRVPSFLTTLAPTQTVIPQYMAAVITAVSSSLSMFSFLLFLLVSYSAPRDSDLPGPLSARHWYVPRLPQCEFLPLCFFSSFVFLGSTGLCFL